MKKINIDKEWEFRRGFVDSLGGLSADRGVVVNLPHDAMISTDTSEDADALYDWGYFKGGKCNYTKYLFIPKEWEGESVGLSFDGAMMHTNVEVNGCKAGEHHYGYSPFYVDISKYVTFGEENRITINTNTGVEPSARWYPGLGLYRSVELCHGPKVHIANDGIYVYTKDVCEGYAFLEAEIDVCNESLENRLVKVDIELVQEGDTKIAASSSRIMQVDGCSAQTAKMAFTLENPVFWNIDDPKLYSVKVRVTDTGEYRTHHIKIEDGSVDEACTIFGVRTISVDAIRGLLINGKVTKLKGGCVHHDNGLMGAVSIYESEARKVRKLKEIGFNAIRTSHNPPSSALVEACDREGLYIFDEVYDAWGMAKRPGDFSTHFKYTWEEELTAFVKRDRVHPSVVMWSTGNEIPERGGLNNGYTLATKLASAFKKLDASRPVSNGICSLWSGLDDYMAKNQDSSQNASNNEAVLSWDSVVEPFTNGLDVVGYNYMEDLYENSHKRYPDRVILGSENFPKEIGFRWPMVESLPYVIGDFTWTAWDYLGEAGIGKSVFSEPGDPNAPKHPWDIMPPTTSMYPWRLANDADIDITGLVRPQGAYRSVVWGSSKTHLFAQKPCYFGKEEMISMWGFTDVEKNWNFTGYEDNPIELVVFSNADEVELFVNGESVGKEPVSKDRPLPNSVRFKTVYKPGKVEAVSYKNGKEVSRDCLETTGEVAKLIIESEKTVLNADGHDVTYLRINACDSFGRVVSDASVALKITVDGVASLSGFGTGNPKTDENYSDDLTTTYYGQAMAVIRSGYEKGKSHITVSDKDGKLVAECDIEIK